MIAQKYGDNAGKSTEAKMFKAHDDGNQGLSLNVRFFSLSKHKQSI